MTLSTRGAYALACAALVVFIVSGLRHLDSVPQVYEDEPWQASTAYKLASQGVFGSDLFAGFHNMDQRYYGFMPLHPLLMAGFFKILGVGLAQARLETVALTALTLVLTFFLGLRLFSAWAGALAVLLLVFVRWTGLTYVQLSGIPVVDFARIARYDPLVPVLGLCALHIYAWARARGGAGSYALSGVLAGGAGLAHLYGLFWVPALLLLAALDRRWRATAVVGVGAVLPWLPYAGYVLGDVPDWRGQIAVYAGRFGLLDLRWYLDNVVQEYHRYGPGLGPPGAGWLLRPGFWLLLLALPLSLIALGQRARAGCTGARTILVPSLLFPVLFAAFITLKLVNYTLLELPLFAIAIGWGISRVWSRRWLRPLLALVGAAVLIEGGFGLSRLETASLTPYPTYVSAVREYIPRGARVLGLHSYWLGMQDFDYRSFLVPLNWADEGLPLDQGLSRVAPDVVLEDARMRAYFATAPDGALYASWLAAHSATLIGRVDDPTYGLMEIYQIRSDQIRSRSADRS